MKTKRIAVEADQMLEVSQIIADNKITNEIIGVDDDYIIIQVEYSHAQREAIYEILQIANEDDNE